MPQIESASRADGNRRTWKSLVNSGVPLVLPAAHDALTARLIERAGFPAYQIGGLALNGARRAFPDLDLTHFGEEFAAVQDIISASSLPVLVDADDGYGDVKNVTRTIGGYEAMGVSAIFIEDQRAPKSCGQEGSKKIVPDKVMVSKIKAAIAARRNADTFLLARTDARSAVGVGEAIRRAEMYRDAGADGIYVEGLQSARELKRVGKALAGIPLATTLMEGGGKLSWLPPQEIFSYGFAMILYPTTVLFQVVKAIQRAVSYLRAGKPMQERDAINLNEYDEIVGMPMWKEIEKEFQKG